MNTLQPPYLKEGDKVTIVSPSSALLDPALIDGAVRTLQQWGLRSEVAQHALAHSGHFAGTDEERLSDFQQAIDDADTSAILCSRGGYGALRFVDRLNLAALQRQPKWMIGFSDVTALHSAFVHSGCCSLHAPMAKALAHSHSQKSVIHAMHDVLFGIHHMDYKVPYNQYNRQGEACGPLIGGNLSLIYSLQATPFALPADGAILFIEDLSERLYHIDRMMHNLKLSGMLGRIAGLVVGQFTDIDPDPEFGQSVEEIILAVMQDYAVPVSFDFPVGHVNHNFPLIEGAQVRLTVNAEGTHLEEIIKK